MKKFSVFDLDIDYNAEPARILCEIPDICETNCFDSYEILSPNVSSLSDLCAKKLLSDVCMLQNISSQVPKSIHAYLLNKAISSRRTLSIAFLLKCYPYEKFVYPSPVNWNTWTVFCENFQRGKRDVDVIFRDNVEIILSTFCSLIREKRLNNPLCVVDMQYLSVDASRIRDKIWAESVRRRESNQPSPYTLKIHVNITCDVELKSLTQVVYNTTFVSKLNLIITGLNFCNSLFVDKNVLTLLEQIDHEELKVCQFDFCSIKPSMRTTIMKLQKFQNLKALNLNYSSLEIRHFPSHLQTLSKTLNSLPILERLSLKGCSLRGHLPTLFHNVCQTMRCDVKRRKPSLHSECCLNHRGTLKYLNISSCDLVDGDLAYFRELDMCKLLQNLDISCNSFSVECMGESIELLGSNLVVLQMDYSISKTDLTPFISQLHKMKKLKCLRMEGVPFTVENIAKLMCEIREMPYLKCVSASFTKLRSEIYEDQELVVKTDTTTRKVSLHVLDYSTD